MSESWSLMEQALFAGIVILIGLYVGVSFWYVVFPPDNNFEEFGARINVLVCGSQSLFKDECDTTKFRRNVFVLQGDENEGIVLFAKKDATVSVDVLKEVSTAGNYAGTWKPPTVVDTFKFTNPSDKPSICRFTDRTLIESSCVELQAEGLEIVSAMTRSGIIENVKDGMIYHQQHPLTNYQSGIANDPLTYGEPAIIFSTTVVADWHSSVGSDYNQFLVYTEFRPPNKLLVAPYTKEVSAAAPDRVP